MRSCADTPSKSERRDKLLCEIRTRYPEIPIVFVYAAPDEPDKTTVADVCIDVSDPTNLIRALADLFAESSRGLSDRH